MRVQLLNSNSMVASYTDVCNRLKEALVQYGHDVQIISIRMVIDVYWVSIKYICNHPYTYYLDVMAILYERLF